jgi:hypothetical protein
MRRFLIVCLCVFTVGCVLLLLAGRSRGSGGRFEQIDPDSEAGDAGLAEEDGAEETVPDDVVTLANRAGSEAELALERLVRVRADVVARVERRPLFAMAHERGLPNHELFTMSSEQLLDAILEAEGLPPADVLPSPHSEDRMMAVADEAYRRHEEYLAEEAAERDAG